MRTRSAPFIGWPPPGRCLIGRHGRPTGRWERWHACATPNDTNEVLPFRHPSPAIRHPVVPSRACPFHFHRHPPTHHCCRSSGRTLAAIKLQQWGYRACVIIVCVIHRTAFTTVRNNIIIDHRRCELSRYTPTVVCRVCSSSGVTFRKTLVRPLFFPWTRLSRLPAFAEVS